MAFNLLTKIPTRNFFMKPTRHLVGTCPLYGHKYYLQPQQTVLGVTYDEKREADYNLSGITSKRTGLETYVSKFSKSEDAKAIFDHVNKNKMYSLEWEAWLRWKRNDPPTDSEVKMKDYNKKQTAKIGNEIEAKLNATSTRMPGHQRTVFIPGDTSISGGSKKKHTSVGTTKNKKYSGQPKKDGLDEAEVESWDPSKM